jgi:protein O-GlcNAc transferase
MLTWLAKKFEQKRAGLQAHLEKSAVIEAKKIPASSEYPLHWRKMGNAALDAGNLDEAGRCYQTALDFAPDDSLACINLGFVKFEQNLHAEAQPLIERALAIDAKNVDAWYILGGINWRLEDWQAAESAYRQAIQIKSDFEMAYLDLCGLLLQHDRVESAKSLMQEAIANNPKSALPYFFLGNINCQQALWSDAEICFKKALQLQPANANFVNALGQLLLQEGRAVEAADCYKRAAKITPLNAGALNNRGLALHRIGDVYAAIEVFQEALLLEEENAQILCNLGGSLQISGDLKSAAESYRAALNVNPDYTDAHHNLLYALSFLGDCQPNEYLSAAREFGARIAARAIPFSQWTESAGTLDVRPLRVGLVSGDFRNHAVGYFLENVLAHIRPEKLVLVAYSNLNADDELTLRIKPFFPEWNSVVGMKDDDLAKKIHSDKIDILIDLAGHTAGNRLPVFAWRPAPLQLTWLGYWASTGVTEIDYILVDQVSVPKSSEFMFSEKIWYLPDTRFCISPPPVDASTASSPLPAYRNGHITFGSFQVLSKMNDQSLAVWSKVLAEVPNSRLRLQNWQLGYPVARQRLLEKLEELGVQPERVTMHGGSDRTEYLQAYSEVDVILDTYPFPGGTTTLEGLWMGVPTVTQTGSTLIERQGESILRCAGLGNWVASDEQEYVLLARAHVTDLASLAELRSSLRWRVGLTPLFNAASFANGLENALQGMWRAKDYGHDTAPPDVAAAQAHHQPINGTNSAEE